MKYEAMKHQGSWGEKRTADVVGEKAGDSGRTVQRYIRLAELTDELLFMVDAGNIGMTAAEKLSYLKRQEQEWVQKACQDAGRYPTLSQAGKLKECSENETLKETVVYEILAKKEKRAVCVSLAPKKIREYFPPTYTSAQMEEVIYALLEQWKKGKEGEEDAGAEV